jgi:hypothetical protein
MSGVEVAAPAGGTAINSPSVERSLAVWEGQPRVDLSASARPLVRVWDGFTRLTHWLLVVLMGASWWTARHHHMDYHRYSGYALLGVLSFRLYW